MVLESVIPEGEGLLLSIRVLNTTFQKHVFARVTFDDWATYRDITAAYVSSPSVMSDRFSIHLDVPGPRADFALCMVTPINTHWDNNARQNYTVRRE